jgi:hypothetical protein
LNAKKIRGIGDTKQQGQQRKQDEMQDNPPKWSPHIYELLFLELGFHKAIQFHL